MNAHFYNICLQGSEATEDNARMQARGQDWQSIEQTEQDLPNLDFIDTVDGIDIYYDWKADYYCFAPNEDDPTVTVDEAFKLSEDSSPFETVRDGFNHWIKSDNVILSEGLYRAQCSLYKAGMTLEQLQAYYLKQYVTDLRTNEGIKIEVNYED